MKAAAIEKKRLEDLERLAEVKTKMENARIAHDEYDASVAAGMKVQDLDDHVADEDDEGVVSKPVVLKKKTKAQKNKAARLLAEVRFSYHLCLPLL